MGKVAELIIPRRRSKTQTRWLEWNDIIWLLILLALGVVSLGIPQRHWVEACRLIASVLLLRTELLDRLLSKIEIGTRDHRLGISKRDICEWYVTNKLLLQLQYLRAHRPDGWLCEVELEGSEHLDDALARGTGAILWVASSTSSELVAKQALWNNDYRVAQLSGQGHGYSNSRIGRRVLNPIKLAIENRYIMERITLARSAPGIAVRTLQRRLIANNVVSINVTDNKAGESLKIKVLSGFIPVGPGAVYLAYRTSAALLPVFVVRQASGSYRVIIDRPLEVDAKLPMRGALGGTLGHLGKRLHNYALRYPDQWYGWAVFEAD